MDLRLYGQVLWRHRFVVLGGAALALLLAILSFYRVDLSGGIPRLTPRKAEVWQSQASLFLTQAGFPAGRNSINLVPVAVGGQVVPTPQYNQPGALGSLASLYAQLAMSDAVMNRMRRAGPVPGSFLVTPVADSSGRSTQPLLNLFGQAPTPQGAERTVERGLTAFVGYIHARQVAAKIPVSQRVQLAVVNAPGPASVIQPRKKTLPFVIFLAVLFASVALAFILENVAGRRATVTELKPGSSAGTGAEGEPQSEPGVPEEPEPQAAQSFRHWA
jgi:hypothetical protein